MAGITLQQAEEQLQLWLNANTAVASSQSYEIAGRKLTRADAKSIQENIDYWDAKVNQLSRKGIKVRRVSPL